MADYDLLKTITIDGTTMGLAEGLGEVQGRSKTVTDYTVPSSWVNTDPITLEKGGTYLVMATASFGTGSTTGLMRHSLKLTTSLGEHTEGTVDANNAMLQKSFWRVFSPSTDNYTVYASAEASKTINSASGGIRLYLDVWRLVKIPTP